MPWSASDAQRHTEKADTPARQKLWAKVANKSLQVATDQGFDEPDAYAIKVANATVARSHRVTQ